MTKPANSFPSFRRVRGEISKRREEWREERGEDRREDRPREDFGGAGSREENGLGIDSEKRFLAAKRNSRRRNYIWNGLRSQSTGTETRP